MQQLTWFANYLFTDYCLHAHDTVSAYKAQDTAWYGYRIEGEKLLNAISEEIIKSSH